MRKRILAWTLHSPAEPGWPNVPVMLLSGDECLPEEVLEAADCFLFKSEPIAGFLEQVDICSAS
jgi:hypothetical protein